MPQSSKHTQKLIEDEDILFLQEPHMVSMEHQDKDLKMYALLLVDRNIQDRKLYWFLEE